MTMGQFSGNHDPKEDHIAGGANRDKEKDDQSKKYEDFGKRQTDRKAAGALFLFGRPPPLRGRLSGSWTGHRAEA
jgi:hypothetical protein